MYTSNKPNIRTNKPNTTTTYPESSNPSHSQHQLQSRPQQPPRNAVLDLLPYCTAGAPLNQAQIVALSDTVGSLKELALMAVAAAAGEQDCMAKLAGALGEDEAVNVVEFFAGEWEVCG